MIYYVEIRSDDLQLSVISCTYGVNLERGILNKIFMHLVRVKLLYNY
jgi:hypothetical protein